MTTRTCKTCGITYPLNGAYFHGNGGKGFRNECKACRRAYARNCYIATVARKMDVELVNRRRAAIRERARAVVVEFRASLNQGD